MADTRILCLVGARALGTFGRAVINATVPWELYERTHDKLVLGAVGLVQVIPVVLLFVPAGTLVDRSDRRNLTTAAAATTGLIGIGLALASGDGRAGRGLPGAVAAARRRDLGVRAGQLVTGPDDRRA